jgi:tetratricopeptide (TPR) repeat protein
MALRDMGDQKGFETSLREADHAFHTIQSGAELYLSNAYNGVGSVTLLQGRFEEALRWIDKALELVPDHPYALHDHEEALRFLKGGPH